MSDLLLNNSAIRIEGVTDPSFQITNVAWSYDDARDFFIATLSQSFKNGQEYSIYLEYSAQVDENNFGLYKSFFYDENGKKSWLVATQMAPTDARRVFPCFDEPAMKASFTIKLLHHKSFVAFSNMPNDKEPEM